MPGVEVAKKLQTAVENVKVANGVVKAFKQAAYIEPEPEPEPPPESTLPATATNSFVVTGDKSVGIHTAIARQTASFIIQGADTNGTHLRRGGALFFVAVRGSSLVKARVTDNGDGTYLCEYRPSVSGNFSIAVSLQGTPLPGSPFALSVLQPRPDPPQCVLSGDGLRAATARERTEFFVEYVDRLGQVTHAEELDVWVELDNHDANALGNPLGAVAELAAAHKASGGGGGGSGESGEEGGEEGEEGAEGGEGGVDETGAATGATADIGTTADSLGPPHPPAGEPDAAAAAAAVGGGVSASAAAVLAGGGSGSQSTHTRLEAGERQQHLQLWARRLAADKAITAAAAKAAARSDGGGASGASGSSAGVGMSLANELMDKRGIGFAFGGVTPGTLHAKGQLVKVHTVQYSVGLAGSYLLHVGLRQQGVALPGSPFRLVVSPGNAYAAATRLSRPTTQPAPLAGPAAGGDGAKAPAEGGRDAKGGSPQGAAGGKGGGFRGVFGGVVGKEWHGMTMVASDKMGNACIAGGATVRCCQRVPAKPAMPSTHLPSLPRLPRLPRLPSLPSLPSLPRLPHVHSKRRTGREGSGALRSLVRHSPTSCP